MPIESPDQFEKSTLKGYLSAIDDIGNSGCRLYCMLFGIAGILLLIVVFVLHDTHIISTYWLYLICIIAGITLGGAAIISRLGAQSKLILDYINTDAIEKRIAEINSKPRQSKSNGDEWN